jgi:RNA polymerase sigma-70 factor, ECF subfamily
MPPSASQPGFEALLAPIVANAYRVAYHLTRHRDDAEDLVQEAALQAFRAFGSFRPGTNFRAWFLRILTNLHYQRHRKSRREPAVVDLEDAPELYLYTQTAKAGLHQLADDPAALVLDRLDAGLVMEALGQLPEDYRIAAALYFVEELSYEEIAAAVGCPIGTVRSRLHRGRRLLQKALWELAEQRGIVRELEGGKETE